MPAFAELAKRAYVDAALQDFAIPGREPSVSRADDRAARVVSGWVHDPQFRAADGAPLELPLDAASPSFSELVRAHGGDVALPIGTTDHDLQGLEPARFQRKVAHDNLSVEAVGAFRAIAARHGQALPDERGDRLARHDRDNHPDVGGTGRTRAGVGVFMFEETVGSELPGERTR